MTRTTGRTFELLALLQSRLGWTGAELRERLEVSDRTLRRDIDDLRERGYGIEATRGRGGGYRLGAGAAVPPLSLTVDECVAIAVGLRAAATGVVTGIEEAAARALAKLERSLAPSTRNQISDVEQAMIPLSTRRNDVDITVVTTMTDAISARRRVRFDYTRHDGKSARRVVEPHRIVHTAERWYLVAWNPEHAAWRTLRIDRIRRPVILPESFDRREIPEEEVRKFTVRSITTAPYRFRARVRIFVPAEVVSGHFDQTVAQVVDGGHGTSILTAGSNTPEEFALYVGISGFEFEVFEGEELRDALSALSARALRAVQAGAN